MKVLFIVTKFEPHLVYLLMNGASIGLAAVESTLIVGQVSG